MPYLLATLVMPLLWMYYSPATLLVALYLLHRKGRLDLAVFVGAFGYVAGVVELGLVGAVWFATVPAVCWLAD